MDVPPDFPTLGDQPDLVDPIAQFARWLDEATRAGGPEPTAMALATADAARRPSVRMVLLKGFGPDGFTFFSNSDSRKGTELAANPWAALCFWWGALQRQVRLEGPVARLPAADSDAYFATRARDSQLSTHASPQSRIVPDRAWLEARVAALDIEHAGRPVPRPAGWGGYQLAPEVIEFWHGRPHRLHDRLRYTRVVGGWRLERLAP